ncbi:hypothetical protein [Nostoc sp.]
MQQLTRCTSNRDACGVLVAIVPALSCQLYLWRLRDRGESDGRAFYY